VVDGLVAIPGPRDPGPEEREALESALFIHQISPGDSVLAAFAAFELGREPDARALFLHAALNRPGTVGSLKSAQDRALPRNAARGAPSVH
jgi:hypothetical protein